MLTLFWIAVALVFAVLEVATVALFAAFLAAGALGAAVVAYLGAGPFVQALVFLAVAGLGLLLVRRPLLAYLKRRSGPATVSGAASMIGQSALVVDPIGGPLGRGHVRVLGEDWPAMSADGSPVAAGATVRIVDIHQTTLVVDAGARATAAS